MSRTPRTSSRCTWWPSGGVTTADRTPSITGTLDFPPGQTSLPGDERIAVYRDGEFSPGPSVSSDAEILSWIRNNSQTAYHPIGTCRMGSDARAVVDPQLRVRGVERLRVIDASVMPTVTSANTNAPTIMIAEKAADRIRADA